MRLEKYLNEKTYYEDASGRVQEIDIETWIKLAKENCMDAIGTALKHDGEIWRGDYNKGIFFKGDASVSTRRSRNTSNYYTLWMDNHSSWSKFPKRSKSFICCTDKSYADGYGSNLKLILPYNGVKIGVCSGDDLWNSFPNIRSGLGDASDFNYILQTFINIILTDSKDMFDNSVYYDTDWSTFKKAIKQVDEYNIDDMPNLIENRKNDISPWALHDIQELFIEVKKKNKDH